MAEGSGSNRGTGGMVTKLYAADYATKRGTEVHIVNGEDPNVLYDVFEGRFPGTVFSGQE
jgi:glutamate 5-kinase